MKIEVDQRIYFPDDQVWGTVVENHGNYLVVLWDDSDHEQVVPVGFLRVSVETDHFDKKGGENAIPSDSEVAT